MNPLTLLAVVALAGGRLVVGPEPEGPVRGLVGCWSFEGEGSTVRDTSAWGNHGVLHRAERVTGPFGGAVAFLDEASYVSIPSSSSLNLGSRLTLSAWICPQDMGINSRVVLSKNDEYMIRIDGPLEGNRLSFFVHVGDPAVTWEPRVQGAAQPVSNEWLHVAAVWDGATMRIYLNGETAGEQPRVGRPNPTPYPLMIGNWEYPSCHGIHSGGAIDEVRVYNRALSEVEVRQLAGIAR